MEKSFGKTPKKTLMDNFKRSGSCALDLAKTTWSMQLVLWKERHMGIKEILYFHDVRR